MLLALCSSIAPYQRPRSSDYLPMPAFVGPDAAEPAGAPLDAAAWLLAEVQSGAARVGAAISGAFVPQMLGYESLGAVDFQKGCYPGQE